MNYRTKYIYDNVVNLIILGKVLMAKFPPMKLIIAYFIQQNGDTITYNKSKPVFKYNEYWLR